MTNETTKAQIDRVVTEVYVFCESACSLIGSFMPIGLGTPWQREHDELTFLLTEIPMRFQRAIRKAQRKGWAAK